MAPHEVHEIVSCVGKSPYESDLRAFPLDCASFEVLGFAQIELRDDIFADQVREAISLALQSAGWESPILDSLVLVARGPRIRGSGGLRRELFELFVSSPLDRSRARLKTGFYGGLGRAETPGNGGPQEETHHSSPVAKGDGGRAPLLLTPAQSREIEVDSIIWTR